MIQFACVSPARVPGTALRKPFSPVKYDPMLAAFLWRFLEGCVVD